MDLAGNTFWEMKDQLNANRLRRIARHNPKLHYADVQVTPQWHQWLRHTRPDAPTLEEQRMDVERQIGLKHLARLADERWAAKPSYLDPPEKAQQPAPATLPKDPGGYAPPTAPDGKEGVRNLVASPAEQQGDMASEDRKPKEDPWKKARAINPGDDYQPQSWTPKSRR